MPGDVIDLPPPDERGPWATAVLDCRACGHTHIGVAPKALFDEDEPFVCPKCLEPEADVPWAACDVTCVCGKPVRAVVWEPVDILPRRWPCPSCGASVPLPSC